MHSLYAWSLNFSQEIVSPSPGVPEKANIFTALGAFHGCIAFFGPSLMQFFQLQF